MVPSLVLNTVNHPIIQANLEGSPSNEQDLHRSVDFETKLESIFRHANPDTSTSVIHILEQIITLCQEVVSKVKATETMTSQPSEVGSHNLPFRMAHLDQSNSSEATPAPSLEGDQPIQQDQENAGDVMVMDLNHNMRQVLERKKRKQTKEEKVSTNVMRKRGACSHCKNQKRKCSLNHNTDIAQVGLLSQLKLQNSITHECIENNLVNCTNLNGNGGLDKELPECNFSIQAPQSNRDTLNIDPLQKVCLTRGHRRVTPEYPALPVHMEREVSMPDIGRKDTDQLKFKTYRQLHGVHQGYIPRPAALLNSNTNPSSPANFNSPGEAPLTTRPSFSPRRLDNCNSSKRASLGRDRRINIHSSSQQPDEGCEVARKKSGVGSKMLQDTVSNLNPSPNLLPNHHLHYKKQVTQREWSGAGQDSAQKFPPVVLSPRENPTSVCSSTEYEPLQSFDRPSHSIYVGGVQSWLTTQGVPFSSNPPSAPHIGPIDLDEDIPDIQGPDVVEWNAFLNVSEFNSPVNSGWPRPPQQ